MSSNLPPCPRCGTNREVKAYREQRLFFCAKCKGQFDDDPDEGGTYRTDPTRRIESEEEFRNRNKERREREQQKRKGMMFYR